MQPGDPDTENVAPGRIRSAPPPDTSSPRQPAAQGSGEGDSESPPVRVVTAAQVQERFSGMERLVLPAKIIEELRVEIIRPFQSQGEGKYAATAGMVLHGPPGCGKTSIARAVAKDAG